VPSYVSFAGILGQLGTLLIGRDRFKAGFCLECLSDTRSREAKEVGVCPYCLYIYVLSFCRGAFIYYVFMGFRHCCDMQLFKGWLVIPGKARE